MAILNGKIFLVITRTAALSTACNKSYPPNAGFIDSNPTRDMGVGQRSLYVCDSEMCRTGDHNGL